MRQSPPRSIDAFFQPFYVVENNNNELYSSPDGSPGLVVVGGDSCFKCHGFESQHRKLKGHFSHLFVVRIVLYCKDENKCKRGQGWPIKKLFSSPVDCSDPTCSGHGFCVDGACICKKGWKGSDCSTLDEEARQCLPDCSTNGKFDLETQQCVCQDGWVGEDCSSRLCDLDCGEHGRYDR